MSIGSLVMLRRVRETKLPYNFRYWMFDEAAGVQCQSFPPNPGFDYFELTVDGARGEGPAQHSPYVNWNGALLFSSAFAGHAAISSSADPLAMNGVNRLTCAFWFKRSSAIRTRAFVSSNGRNAFTVRRHGFAANSYLSLYTLNGGDTVWKYGPPDDALNEWHHWVCVGDLTSGDGDILRWYRDGVRWDGGGVETWTAGRGTEFNSDGVWFLLHSPGAGAGNVHLAEFIGLPGFAADDADAARLMSLNVYRGRGGLFRGRKVDICESLV